MSTLEPYRGALEPRDIAELATRLEPPRKPDNIDLAWLFMAFRRRMGLFLLTIAATILLVFVFCIVIPPQYTATARVTINERTVSPTPLKDTPVVSQLPSQSPDVDTETQVIQSRRVAGLVVDRLRLDHDPEFSGNKVSFKQALDNFVLWFFHPAKYESPRDRVIDAVLGNLDPERYLTTNAIDINFKDNNPAKAQKIANAFAQAYLDDQVESKARANRLATEALESQIDSLRREAAADADKVQAYKIAHNLMTVGVTSNAQTMTQELISSYQQAVSQAKVEQAAAEASLHAAQQQLASGSNGDNLGASLNSGVVSSLRAQRAVLSGKLADLQAHYGPKYPDLKQAREQLADIDREILGENLRIISNLSVGVDVSRKRVASLESTLAATKGSLIQDNVALAGLESLVRNAAVSQAMYEAYLDRFKQSAAQASSQTPDAEIVSVAGLPADPSFPIIWLFLPLGVVAGGLFGCAAVLIAEMLETRMATAEDVEEKLGRPYLGGIPQLSSVLKGRRLSPLDAVLEEPMSAYSEAFRGLLASINLAGPDSRLGALLVTSALPREGKTTIAVGLARTSARQGVATVLIDCDVRRRGLTRALRLDDSKPGLIEVLKGEASIDDALLTDAVSGAQVMGLRAGQAPSDDLVGGEAMDSLLALLRDRHRAVILDAPALQIAVTRRLAAKTHATILVARWRKTTEAGLRAAIRLLPPDQAPLVGVALNRIDMAQQAKYGFGNPGHFYENFKQYYA